MKRKSGTAGTATTSRRPPRGSLRALRPLLPYAVRYRGRTPLGWLPRGTHDWDKFVTPRELGAAVDGGGLRVADTTGVVLDPLRNGWRRSRDTGVNYMLVAERD